MNQQVTDYIGKISQEWQADVCNQLRQTVHQSIPDVEERIQYGKPHFLNGGKYACVLGTAKDWVSFTIFNASKLQAPDGLFEPGDSPDRKTIKVRKGQTLDYGLVAKLLQAASAA
jgi:hypothetical protein